MQESAFNVISQECFPYVSPIERTTLCDKHIDKVRANMPANPPSGAALQRLPRIPAWQDLDAEESKQRPPRRPLRLNLGADFNLLRRGDDVARRGFEVIAQGGPARPPSPWPTPFPRAPSAPSSIYYNPGSPAMRLLIATFPRRKERRKCSSVRTPQRPLLFFLLPFLCSDIFRRRPTLSLRIL